MYDEQQNETVVSLNCQPNFETHIKTLRKRLKGVNEHVAAIIKLCESQDVHYDRRLTAHIDELHGYLLRVAADHEKAIARTIAEQEKHEKMQAYMKELGSK